MTNLEEVRKKILNFLEVILESWSGEKLSKEVVFYGVRRYLKGAYMSLHVDKVPTHILSAILQVSYFMI